MSAGTPLEELARLPEFYHPTADATGSRVAFYWDVTGRNELYVLDLTTGETERVSDGEVPRDASHSIVWHPDGDRIFFHRDQGGDEQTDVHVLDVAGGSAEPVIEMDGRVLLDDVSGDGRYLLVASTAGDQMNLYRHDLDAGPTERLTDYARPVGDASFAPGGDRIAYTTNESDDLDNEDAYVAAADGTGARRLPVGEPGYETTVSDWGPDGERLLVGDDSTGVGRAGVYDLEADDVAWLGPNERPEWPVALLDDGRAVVLQFRKAGIEPLVYPAAATAGREPDAPGRQLALDAGVASFPGDEPLLGGGQVLVTRTTPTRRNELLRYDLDDDSHETLVEARYGDVDRSQFVAPEYVTYESGEYDIGALVYDSGERPSPGVVMVHGGPHGASLRSFSAYVQFLTSRGYTVLQPNFRGSAGRGREFRHAVRGDWGGAEQRDVANGGRWLARREWVDEERLAVFGGSFGGYSAYMQLVRFPEVWATGIAWCGITDLHALLEESMPHYETFFREQMGDPEENADLWRERSPIEHVEDLDRPLLVAHGVNDPRCPISQARRFRDALLDRGWVAGETGDFEYVELDDEGHGSTDVEQKVRAFRIVADYLDRRL